MDYSIKKTDEAWKALLGAERFRILRQKGTEYPHSGRFNLFFEAGQYCCGGCGEILFESEAKFDSHCGWPSFDKAVEGAVAYISDTTMGMRRTEIVCAHCGGHLGHVFEDGPTQTRQRFCVNSLSIDFESGTI